MSHSISKLHQLPISRSHQLPMSRSYQLPISPTTNFSILPTLNLTNIQALNPINSSLPITPTPDHTNSRSHQLAVSPTPVLITSQPHYCPMSLFPYPLCPRVSMSISRHDIPIFSWSQIPISLWSHRFMTTCSMNPCTYIPCHSSLVFSSDLMFHFPLHISAFRLVSSENF